MGKRKDKMRNILKKKKQLIGVILIAVILIISIIAIIVTLNGEKVISTESKSDISTESTTESATVTNSVQDKIACGFKIKFLYEEKYWEKYDLTNAVYKTQGAFEDAVCKYIDEIAKLLNKQDWCQQIKGKDTIYIKLVVHGKEYYEKYTKLQYLEEFEETMPGANYGGLREYTPKAYIYEMTLSSAMFEHNIVPIVHALTDLITYKKDSAKSGSYSGPLRTGLNEYMQNFLGMGINSCNYGLDIHNYVIEHSKMFENNPKLKSNIGTKGLFWYGFTYGSYTTSSLDLTNFGVGCSNSFVTYLVQTYGLENVMKMVDGYDDSIYYLFNQNGIEGLISDWQQFLDNYNCKMTWDEMNAYMTEFRNTHGY
ncbi:hypothetical protein [[Clostridium] fimetarium]|uniref:Uncharacterized protein n=1 Tax=[Clostridium] fimetarium TaxID=99656 RepID=A0A1I0MFT8_9FIRM|nr:hypothetical protein [[Clostridium] fimetarium]SEV86804.1 hypothetical protein SAMN05421659_101459 [[Clostridium] fimetarium]